MEKTKKNNKGFSLVELIVVVLIMAIIAVALAPQVMKWVENSRVATDVSNYDSLVANCQLALTDANAYSAVSSTTYTITYNKTSMKVEAGTTEITALDNTATDNFVKALNALDPSWSSLRAKVTSFPDGVSAYVITINAGGTVTRTTAPDGSAVK